MSLCGLTLTLLEFGRAHIFLRSDNQDWNGPAIRSACYDAAVEIRSQPWLALLKTLRKRRRPFILSGWTLSVSIITSARLRRCSRSAWVSTHVITCSALAHRSPRGFRPGHGSR